MKSNDMNQTREQNLQNYRAAMQKAFTESDVEGFNQALDGMMQQKAEALRDEYEQKMQQMVEEHNGQIMAARGANQLTAEERNYYKQFANAASAVNPKQAVENLSVVMPKSIINRVFEDLASNHPLLNKLNFMAAAGLVEVMINTNGYQEAAWGQLTDEIIKEMTSGFKTITANLLKLSAFLPVCKAMLDLGPEWLDKYIREVLYEAMANGLEAGFVAGDGKGKPIGMIRQSGEGVTVTDGVYPEKDAIAISDLSTVTVGDLLAQIATDPNGKVRGVNDVIFLVNPVDYYQKVMPATTLMAPDGSFRNDVMPYPMDVIQSPSVPSGKAVLGMARRYIGLLGTTKEGKIEYSDQYRFLEDERVYLIKGYANGLPADNNAFLLLDISNLQPVTYTVQQTVAAEAAAAEQAAE